MIEAARTRVAPDRRLNFLVCKKLPLEEASWVRMIRTLVASRTQVTTCKTELKSLLLTTCEL